VEVMVQVNRGWYPAALDENIFGAYLKDVEVLIGSSWRRAALVTIYATHGSVPHDNDTCVLNFECSGCSYMNWRQFKQNARPYTPTAIDMPSGKEMWDVAIDNEPLDWSLRAVYADWLEEIGWIWLMKGQRHQIEYKKTPGPACVLEAAWHEATWFAENIVNERWSMQGREAVIKPEWCVSTPLFGALKGHILQRRDAGTHNLYAKSWNGRREAEIALALALTGEKQ
jgi:hypothetical protein